MFAIYHKQFQQQPSFQLQLHTMPIFEEENLKPNKDLLNVFLGSLMIPHKINSTETFLKCTETDLLHLRVLLNNLAVVLQKDQDLLQLQQPQQFFYPIYSPQVYYDQSLMPQYEMAYDTIQDNQQFLGDIHPSQYHYDMHRDIPQLSDLHHPNDLHLHTNDHQ